MSVPDYKKRAEEDIVDEATGEPTGKVGRSNGIDKRGRATTYAGGVKAKSPSQQKGPIDKELDKLEHDLMGVVRKVRQMGVRVGQNRNPATGRLEWRVQGRTYNYLTFGKFADGVFEGDGKATTLGEMARMATNYAKWVSDKYLIPKNKVLAKKSFPTPWYKGDPDPKWDELIKRGKQMAFWADVASAMGWVYLGLAGAGFAGAIIYGAGSATAAVAGLDLTRHLALKGMSLGGVFDGKIAVGSSSVLQQRYLQRLLRRRDILHRYFNENESSVAFGVRQGVAQVIEATAR